LLALEQQEAVTHAVDEPSCSQVWRQNHFGVVALFTG